MDKRYVCVKKADVELEDENLICECAMKFKIFQFATKNELEQFVDWLKKTETDYLLA